MTARGSTCDRCGYDRTSVPADARCAECGLDPTLVYRDSAKGEPRWRIVGAVSVACALVIAAMALLYALAASYADV